jgi:hypothetical protein
MLKIFGVLIIFVSTRHAMQRSGSEADEIVLGIYPCIVMADAGCIVIGHAQLHLARSRDVSIDQMRRLTMIGTDDWRLGHIIA